MEENDINTDDFYLSLKRIEFLMEQIVLHQIQTSTNSQEETNEKFQLVLRKVESLVTEEILRLTNMKKVALEAVPVRPFKNDGVEPYYN